jgi:CBS domain-containing protein
MNALYENIPIAHICQIGEVNTAITKRAIELSVLKWKRSLLSDLHVKYRSQGRKEQLLLTDQDNAWFFKM